METRDALYIKGERIDQLINGTWTINYMKKINSYLKTHTYTFCLGRLKTSMTKT